MLLHSQPAATAVARADTVEQPGPVAQPGANAVPNSQSERMLQPACSPLNQHSW